jgi:ethanolamine utilization protein EutN
MRIGRTIGSLTLCRWHPLLAGATFRVAIPLSLANLRGEAKEDAEEIILLDELGAANGQLIAIAEGAEAANPYHPETKPIDGYCSAILDQIDVSTRK